MYKSKKKYFNLKGIEYKEINVADKHEDREEVFKVSEQRTVLAMDINGKEIIGFDKKIIDEELEK